MVPNIDVHGVPVPAPVWMPSKRIGGKGGLPRGVQQQGKQTAVVRGLNGFEYQTAGRLLLAHHHVRQGWAKGMPCLLLARGSNTSSGNKAEQPGVIRPSNQPLPTPLRISFSLQWYIPKQPEPPESSTCLKMLEPDGDHRLAINTFATPWRHPRGYGCGRLTADPILNNDESFVSYEDV